MNKLNTTPLKVKQLMELLKDMPQDANLCFQDDCSRIVDIVCVDIIEVDGAEAVLMGDIEFID
jgi:hypothetical protein